MTWRWPKFHGGNQVIDPADYPRHAGTGAMYHRTSVAWKRATIYLAGSIDSIHIHTVVTGSEFLLRISYILFQVESRVGIHTAAKISYIPITISC